MRAALAAACAAVLLAGCGDPDLWARWRAERALFHARRAAARVEGMGRHAAERQIADAESRLAAIVTAFPASRWGSPPARGPARDVALASARASVALARIAASTGDDAGALDRWQRAREQWGAFPGAVTASRVGAARALERLGRLDEALAERRALAAMDPLGDPDRRGPAPDVLAAPARVASELRALGRDAEAVEVLRTAEGRFAAALARARPDEALAVAHALAGIRVSLGDPPGALAALRTTLAGLRAWEVPARVVTLADCAFEAGEYDSAITYTRWAAAASNTRAVAGAALVLAARAWEARGRTDSAFAAYAAIFDRWPDPGLIAPEAHFWRASLLERLGQWDRASAEFAALAAAAPTHPMAFRATLRVVRHHLDQGHRELARLDGENAIERLEHLLATNRAPEVQRQAGIARADLLADLGFGARAESSLVDLWRRFPEDSAAESAALRGASLAEHRPGGRAAAAAIYEELARHAASPPVRRIAAQRRSALGPVGPTPFGENRP